jgi:hypothetical protein
MSKKLSDFRLANEKEIEDLRLSSGIGIEGGAIFRGSPGGINRMVIFRIMYETFGPPNTEPGDKSTWEWVIYTQAGFLTVYDFKGSWSIGYLGNRYEPSDELLAEASLLRDAILEEANKVLKEPNVGGEIWNPYALHRLCVENLMNQAKQIAYNLKNLEKESEELKNKVFQSVENSDINRLIEDLIKKVESSLEDKKKEDNLPELSEYYKLVSREEKMQITLLSLYIAAFMCTYLSLEGFVNLVYTLFLKDKYRNDNYENQLKKETLLGKILKMDEYCHSFKHPPLSEKDELFAAIQHFINIVELFKNTNLIDISFELVNESFDLKSDIDLPLPSEFSVKIKIKSERKYGLLSDIIELSNFDIILANRLIRKLIVRVLKAMEDEIKYPFAIWHSNMWIEYIRMKSDKTHFAIYDFPKSTVESILRESTELDQDYFKVNDEVYMPFFYLLWLS